MLHFVRKQVVCEMKAHSINLFVNKSVLCIPYLLLLWADSSGSTLHLYKD